MLRVVFSSLERVCYRHFVSGQAAKQWYQFDVDWAPTLHLGHTKRLQRIDPQLNADRAERRKRRQEIIDREISEKMKKLNEPGETVESIFSEVEHTCTTQEAEESDQLQGGNSEDEQMGELEMEMYVAGEKLVEDADKKPILANRDSQTLVSAMAQETADAATQTTEFDYLRKHSHLRKITLKILMIKLDFTRDYRTSIYLLKHSNLFHLMSPGGQRHFLFSRSLLWS